MDKEQKETLAIDYLHIDDLIKEYVKGNGETLKETYQKVMDYIKEKREKSDKLVFIKNKNI